MERQSSELVMSNTILQEEIADRQLSEEAIHENQELFRSAFDYAAIGMALVSPEGDWLRVNSSLCKIVGYSEQELLATTFQALTHPDDLAIDINYVRQMLAGEIHSYQMEKRYFHKLGHIVWILLSVSLVNDAQGNPRYFIAQIQDITERKLAEEALRASQRQYESLVESIDGIVWEADAQTFRFTFVSKQAERILGYPLERWLNEPEFWQRHLHPEDHDQAIGFCKDATERKVDHQFEYRMIAADGRLVLLRDIVTVHVMDDQSVRLRGIMVDITAAKRAEEELRKQKEILQKIFDHVPVMICLLDEDGRFELVNREWERVRGWSLKEIEKQNLDVLTAGYPDPQHRQKVMDFITAASGEWGDFKTRARDGRMIDAAWAIVRLSDGTRVCIGKDITKRKQAEEELKASHEQLRALSAHLQSVREEESARVAREIHDELGQLLTGLLIDLSWLEDRLPASDVTLLEKVRSMVELTEMTIDTVRRIATELKPALLDDFGLAAAVEWYAQEFQKRTGIKCEITSNLDDTDLPPDCSTAIFRIFQEALTNIARHSGAIRVEIALEERDEGIALEVRDNGRGISEGELSSHRSLGILGMRERARLLDGTVQIVGVRGSGTTVTVRVPLPCH